MSNSDLVPLVQNKSRGKRFGYRLSSVRERGSYLVRLVEEEELRLPG